MARIHHALLTALAVAATTLTLILFGCSSDNSAATTANAPKHSATLYLYMQVTRYANRIADISKTINGCAEAERAASPEHPDTTLMTDEELQICGGDDKAVDNYLSFPAPDGFANTFAVVQGLRSDLENHDVSTVNGDVYYKTEVSDVQSIIAAFKYDLSKAPLSQTVKARILTHLP